MRVVVLGATGHIGSYLVPRLAYAGHDVVAVSRGRREPYHEDPGWEMVRRVSAERTEQEYDVDFGNVITGLAPDVLIDLICYTPRQAEYLLVCLRGSWTRVISCGSIWVHGHATEVPLTEASPRNPFGDYGIRKAAIEEILLGETRAGGLQCTVLHPGHISGPGWPVVNPAGNFDLAVWERLAAGRPVTLPLLGLETVHHVHADDVAQAFALAVDAVDAIAGQSFHIVSDRALTLRGFAEAVAGWFGRDAALGFAPWVQFAREVGPENAAATLDHIGHSPSVSNAKARAMLGYRPRYTSLAAVADAVRWLAANGRIDVPLRDFGPHPV
ncbi:NAD-dependent epimerase/dehydratase family protein [Specibacter cremeus]|uniref:NAD-dependent epimerase/dehydratase family protein n=1 Tax=Specibacter cremeus TaxID=1629051 RepID=UPI000F7A4347|nr:NAD-dependent epimerase/dehydratase family protein [Specibacter cremeus]